MTKINPDFISPCGLYCGVCAIYIAHRDKNQKFKEVLLSLYKGGVPGKGILPNSEKLSIEDIKCRGCLSDEQLCTADNVRSENARKRKVTPDVINAMNFLVSILNIFRWL